MVSVTLNNKNGTHYFCCPKYIKRYDIVRSHNTKHLVPFFFSVDQAGLELGDLSTSALLEYDYNRLSSIFTISLKKPEVQKTKLISDNIISPMDLVINGSVAHL